MKFSLKAKEGSARAGILETSVGSIQTPVFMPVATQGSVKALDNFDLEKLGAEIIGCAFVVELDFLNGRKKLSKYDIHSLIHY